MPNNLYLLSSEDSKFNISSSQSIITGYYNFLYFNKLSLKKENNEGIETTEEEK